MLSTNEPKGYQLEYRNRKASGLCTFGGCHNKPVEGRTRCQKHLRMMTADQQKRYRRRMAEGLCTMCGQRPRFWGAHCIICRHSIRKKVLPAGALKALRLFREAEKQRAIEHAQVEARFAARKLLISGEIKGAEARALRLYVGADTGICRTSESVGKLMGVSKRRVHKLLQPARSALDPLLKETVGGRPRRRKRTGSARNMIKRISERMPSRIPLPRQIQRDVNPTHR